VNSKGSSNIQAMRERLSQTLKAAYEHVRVKQRSDAEKSMLRRRGTTYTAHVTFAIGKSDGTTPYEFAMLWEPQQPKKLALGNGDEVRAPSKWTPKWTGPHKVVGKILNDQGNFHRYVIWHNSRAKTEKCHVNRLNKFNPWSTELPSTSYWLDGRLGYEQGGFAQTDELIIVPLQKPYYFGVGKVSTSKADGSLEYQWWGNTNDNNKGTFQPGWRRVTHPQVYYADKRKHHSHKPYMGSEDVIIKQKDIILHGFELTEGGRLPASVRRALEDDVRVGGDSDQQSQHTDNESPTNTICLLTYTPPLDGEESDAKLVCGQ
jgi:hypothetical protein